MSEKEKLSIGKEFTDEELMEMTGGSSFRIACQKNYGYKPSRHTIMYGIVTDPKVIAMDGIQPNPIAQPLYGIDPTIRPLYGVEPDK